MRSLLLLSSFLVLYAVCSIELLASDDAHDDNPVGDAFIRERLRTPAV